MAPAIMLPSVASQYFSVAEEFLYSLKFHLTVIPTFDRFTTHPLTTPTRHPHPLWMGQLMVLEMKLRSGSFRYFAAMDGILWALAQSMLTLRPTCIAARPLTGPSRKERAIYSREGKWIVDKRM
jgi:hypothetical protein